MAHRQPKLDGIRELLCQAYETELGGAKLYEAALQCATDEDHHLYYTRGWAREMWIESMGFKAVLPPPEEVKKVESAAEAARAERSRGKMM